MNFLVQSDCVGCLPRMDSLEKRTAWQPYITSGPSRTGRGLPYFITNCTASRQSSAQKINVKSKNTCQDKRETQSLHSIIYAVNNPQFASIIVEIVIEPAQGFRFFLSSAHAPPEFKD